MTEQEIVINSIEEKTTKANKPYLRLDTNVGWLSSFDAQSNSELRKCVGKEVLCEVEDSGQFKNIKHFIEVVGEATSTPMTEAKKVTSATTMYVSYAKDIFIELYKTIGAQEGLKPEEYSVEVIMKKATKLVKQAQKEFEQSLNDD